MSAETKVLSKIATADEVEKATVPEGGSRIYLTDDYQWIVRKMEVPVYKMIKKMVAIGKETEAACYAVKTLMVTGTIDPNDIDDIDYLMGLENGVSQLMNPVIAQVKKN